ncbi:MAG: glycosyltransferase [Gammaproteobacteria bacterium]
MRSLLTFVTLYGFNFVFWGVVGLLRLIAESARSRGKAVFPTWKPMLVGALSLLGVWFSLVAVVPGIVSWEQPLPLLPRLSFWPPGLPLAELWIGPLALFGIAGAYITVKAAKPQVRGGSALLFGVVYWCGFLCMWSLAREQHGVVTAQSQWLLVLLFATPVAAAWFGARVPHTKNNVDRGTEPVRLEDVAVVIAAHNEQESIPLCLDALLGIVPAENIFVGSDGSTDATVAAARTRKCNVLDIQPNAGKARALKRVIDHFEICRRYKVTLIMDADSEVDKNYLRRALPLFSDPAVAAVAGHANPKWFHHVLPRWAMFFIAYRIRLYKLTQALLRYGQTWKHSNVSFIVPGFASMYRCSALEKINITAPGLIIEDFNMTFELHHKRLGKIAYSPAIRCVCEDPHSLRDYAKQVKRWYLGFWQTVRQHGFWPSFFWLALATFIFEMLLQSLVFLLVPVIVVWFLLISSDPVSLWLPLLGATSIGLPDVLIGVFVADYLLTVLIAALERKPLLLFYGFGFVFLRVLDAFLFVFTLPLGFLVKSDGTWASPSRVGQTVAQ